MPIVNRLRGAAGIEAIDLAERHLQALQRLADRLDHPAGERRRRHDMAVPGEQRIVEHLPQPPERMADRRLRQVEPPAGARDAAFRVDGVEHHEQVEVDLG